MPVINKIRIVNFAYNNDNRLIPDTTFDLRSQDGLITLRNGGGKSIMAQVIMQPMIPMGSLGHNAKKRTFDKIFRKDQEPCYVLIEWKLDNNAGFMTNGIAFKRFNNFEDEGNKSSIDYYTFIMDKATCDLNITNLKLSAMEGASLKIKDYYEVKSLIEGHGGKVYKSESEFYKSNLMTYNIYPKEWKSIIAKINGDEGGLLKLFENSVTSKELTENWIVKTIKEAIEGSTNINELSQQTENHIVKARKRIEDRKNRELLNSYTTRLKEFKTIVQVLENIENIMKASKDNIYNLKFTLNSYCKKEEEAVADLNKELLEIEKIIQELEIQTISRDYYKVEEEKNQLSKERLRVKAELEDKERQLKEINKLITSLKVASIKESCKEAEVELAEYEGKIDKLSLEEKDIDIKVRNLGYTIKTIYENKKAEMEANLNQLEEALTFGTKEAEKVKAVLLANKKEEKSFLEESMKLQGKLSYLNEAIEELLEKVENNNLFLGTNEVEIEKEIGVLEHKVNDLKEDILEKYKEKELLEKEKINKVQALEESKEKIARESIKKQEKIKELETFEGTIEELKEKVSRFNIDFSFKEMETSLEGLQTMAKSLDDTIVKTLNEKRDKERALERLSSGGIELNKRFMAYLKEKAITYILGSDYLKSSLSSEEERKKCLKAVPLLPYAFIIERSTLEIIKTNMPEEFYENLTLIIEREELNNMDFYGENSIIPLSRGVYALAHYNKELVIKEDLEGEKTSLKNAILNEEERIALWKEQLKRINLIINEIENLSYEEDYEEKLRAEINDFDNSMSQLIISRENEMRQLKEIEERVKLLEEKTASFLRIKEECEKIIIVFQELIGKVIDKKKTYVRLESLKEELRLKEALIDHEEKKLRNINEKTNDLCFKKIRGEEEYKHIKEKDREFIGFREGTFIQGDLEGLISQYFALKQNSVTGDLNELKAKAAARRDAIKNYKGNLVAFAEEEYEDVNYSFNLERKSEKDKQALSDKIKILTSEEALLKKDVDSKHLAMDKILGSLGSHKIKAKEEIESSLEEKKQAIFNKQQLINLSINNLEAEIEKCRKIEERIQDNLWFEIKDYNGLKKIYKEEYLKGRVAIYEKENNTLKELNQRSEQCKDKIKIYFIDLKRDFSGINQTIDISLKTFEREIEKQINKELSILIDKQTALIGMTLEKLATDLQILDTEQNQIVSSYLDVAKLYTEELLKIDKNSVLTIEKTRRKMMVIDKLNYDEISSPRILSLYLKETLNTLINSEKIEDSSLSKAINKEFSVENLLIHYCDLNNVIVKFYKVEEHISSSDYKKWEEMLPDNSGGEKFVSFFVLLATLINYSRGNHLKKNASSMSIIMDNPFAAISSQHLLIPLFEYARQNNIQLICFSDHDKVDIIDRFNTIIRLAITPLTNKKEVIEAEVMDKEGLSYEEQIEEGYYSYSEQMSLL